MYHKAFVSGDETQDYGNCCHCGAVLNHLNKHARKRKTMNVHCSKCGTTNHVIFKWSLRIISIPSQQLSVPEELTW